MKYENTNQLRDIVESTIKDSGITKTHIANKLGLPRQALSQLLNKKNLTLTDINTVLDIIGYEVHIEVKKKD